MGQMTARLVNLTPFVQKPVRSDAIVIVVCLGTVQISQLRMHSEKNHNEKVQSQSIEVLVCTLRYLPAHTGTKVDGIYACAFVKTRKKNGPFLLYKLECFIGVFTTNKNRITTREKL